MTPSKIESATFQFVAQRLNRLRHQQRARKLIIYGNDNKNWCLKESVDMTTTEAKGIGKAYSVEDK